MARKKDFYSLTDLARMFKNFEIVTPMDGGRVLISTQYLQVNVPRSKLPIQYDAHERRTMNGHAWDEPDSTAAVGIWDSIELGAAASPVKFNGHPVSADTGHNGMARLFRTDKGPMMLAEKYMAFVEIGTGAVAWHIHEKNNNLLVAVNLDGDPVGLVMTMWVFSDDDGARDDLNLAMFDAAVES